MKFQPLGDRVLVKLLDEAQESIGGIILPDSAKEKPQHGEVIALGTGGKDEDDNPKEFTVKVGDKVLMPKYGGTEIKLDDEEFQIVREDDLLGIVVK